MIQFPTLLPTGGTPGVRAAGFPLGTTSDFALALADLAGATPPVAAPPGPPGAVMPTLLIGEDGRQDLAASGSMLPSLAFDLSPDAGILIADVMVDPAVVATVSPADPSVVRALPPIFSAAAPASTPDVALAASDVETAADIRILPGRDDGDETGVTVNPSLAVSNMDRAAIAGVMAPVATEPAPTSKWSAKLAEKGVAARSKVADVLPRVSHAAANIEEPALPVSEDALDPAGAGKASSKRKGDLTPSGDTAVRLGVVATTAPMASPVAPVTTSAEPPAAVPGQGAVPLISVTATRPARRAVVALPAEAAVEPVANGDQRAVAPVSHPRDGKPPAHVTVRGATPLPVALAEFPAIVGSVASAADVPTASIRMTTPRASMLRAGNDPLATIASEPAVSVAQPTPAVIPAADDSAAEPMSPLGAPQADAPLPPRTAALVAQAFAASATPPSIARPVPVLHQGGTIVMPAATAEALPSAQHLPPVTASSIAEDRAPASVVAAPSTAAPASPVSEVAPAAAMPAATPPAAAAVAVAPTPAAPATAAPSPAASDAAAAGTTPVVAPPLSIGAAHRADRARPAPVAVAHTAVRAVPAQPGAQPAQPAAQAFAAAMFAAGESGGARRDQRDDGLTTPGLGGVISQATVAAPATAVQPASSGQQPTLDTKRDDWMASMIDHIETLRDDGGSVRETRMRLAPEALGGVDVAIHRDEGGQVQVRITADTPQARALLAEAAPKLAEMAEARGLKLGGANVASDTGFADGGRRDAPAPQPTPRAAPLRVAADPTDTETDSRLA